MSSRVTIILAVVVALVAAYIFAVDRPEAQRAELARHLIQLRKADVTGLSLTTSKGTVDLVRTDPTHWEITRPFKTPAARFTVSDLLDAVTGIVPQRVLRHVKRDPAVYGFNTPGVQLTLRAPGKKPVTVELGKQDPVGTALYARLDSAPTVYLVDSSVKNSLTKSAADLRQKTLADFANADVQRVRISSPGEPLVIDRTGPDRWRIEGSPPPHARPAWPGDDFKVTDMFFPLTTSEAKHFHDGVTHLHPYGLDHPAVTMDLTLKGRPEPLRILVARVGKVAYGMVAGAPTVLELDPSIIGKLTPRPIALVSTRVVPYNPLNLTAFTWVRDGRQLKIRRQGPGFAGGRLSDQDVSSMFSTMTLLDADKVRALASPPSGKPWFEIRTDGGSGARYTVQFYRQPKGGWIATDRALGLEYVVASSALDALPKSITRFLALPTKAAKPAPAGHAPKATSPKSGKPVPAGSAPGKAGSSHKP